MSERIRTMSVRLGVVAAVAAVVALAAVTVPSMGLVQLPLMLLALLFYVSVPVAVIALGVWLALRLLPQLRIQSTAGGDLGESAVEILKQQYARGKITRDQYLQNAPGLTVLASPIPNAATR